MELKLLSVVSLILILNFASVGSVTMKRFTSSGQDFYFIFLNKIPDADLYQAKKKKKKEEATDCQAIQTDLQSQAHGFIYLAVLEHLLQTLQHLLQLARLDSAVGQQHAPELPLGDPAIRGIVPFKLEGTQERGEKAECSAEGQAHFKAWKADLVPLNLHAFLLDIAGHWRLA